MLHPFLSREKHKTCKHNIPSIYSVQLTYVNYFFGLSAFICNKFNVIFAQINSMSTSSRWISLCWKFFQHPETQKLHKAHVCYNKEIWSVLNRYSTVFFFYLWIEKLNWKSLSVSIRNKPDTVCSELQLCICQIRVGSFNFKRPVWIFTEVVIQVISSVVSLHSHQPTLCFPPFSLLQGAWQHTSTWLWHRNSFMPT